MAGEITVPPKFDVPVRKAQTVPSILAPTNSASTQTFHSEKCYNTRNQEKHFENFVFPFIDTKLISTVKMRY